MKSILVATDYSAPADNAVVFAAQLAEASQAELILFNVFKMGIHSSNAIASLEAIEHKRQKSEARLSELAEALRSELHCSVRYVQGKDDTITSLKQYTDEHPVDLVVMGIESNLVEYKLFGNTTTEAIRLMSFPLLVVPNDIEYEGLRTILFAAEAAYLDSGSEMTILKDFVRTFRSHSHCLLLSLSLSL
jgi:nucleotide-binding universal stress UspA family protein